MNGLMYREYPYLFKAQAQILQHGVDERGVYLILDQSLFYPQGGGNQQTKGQYIQPMQCIKYLMYAK